MYEIFDKVIRPSSKHLCESRQGVDSIQSPSHRNNNKDAFLRSCVFCVGYFGMGSENIGTSGVSLPEFVVVVVESHIMMSFARFLHAVLFHLLTSSDHSDRQDGEVVRRLEDPGKCFMIVLLVF